MFRGNAGEKSDVKLQLTVVIAAGKPCIRGTCPSWIMRTTILADQNYIPIIYVNFLGFLNYRLFMLCILFFIAYVLPAWYN